MVDKWGHLKGGLHFNIKSKSKIQIPRICMPCGNCVDGKLKDSFMEYSSVLSDASDPKLSIVTRAFVPQRHHKVGRRIYDAKSVA